MKLREVPAERSERGGVVSTGSSEALQLAKRNGGISAARGVDEILERGFGGVAHDRIDIVLAYALSARRIERELRDLGAR